jgi:hypothetical protein
MDSFQHILQIVIENVNLTLAEKIAATFENDVPPIWPNLALARYQDDHSVATLREESIEQRKTRRYAIAYYWCPDRAGNLLHNFFSSMIWAMIENRTLLVYFDGTHKGNSKEFCDQFLSLREWLPTYEEWNVHGDITPVPVPMDAERYHYDQTHPVVIYPQIADVLMGNPQVFRQEWRDDPYEKPEYRRYLKVLPKLQRTTAGMLYEKGVDYLIGMLFRHSFDLKMQGTEAQYSSLKPLNPDTSLTIALHSRHSILGDDGSFINQEQDCIEELLQRNKGHFSDCRVFLATDRKLTVSLLSEWLVSKDCEPVVAEHSVPSNNSKFSEHGPWAGVGFLEDLALASHARVATVGDLHRSSFMLLAALVDYDRIMEIWTTSRVEKRDIPQICELPQKINSGYDYGPGTPTFRYYSLAEPLPPIQVIKQYTEWHSTPSTTHQTKYAIVNYACPTSRMGEEAGLERFFNDMIWSIVTNRTILWRYIEPEPCEGASCELHVPLVSDCDTLLRRPDWIQAYDQTVLNSEPVHLYLAKSDEPLDTARKLRWSGKAADIVDIEVVVFPVLTRKRLQDYLHSDIGKSWLLTTAWSRRAANLLYEQSSQFLCGALLYTFLEMLPIIKVDGRPQDMPSLQDEHDSFALNVINKGQDSIETAKSCVEEVFEKLGTVRSKPCYFFSMETPPFELSQSISNSNCSIWTAQVEAFGDPLSRSLNYFRHLALLARARSGYILDVDESPLVRDLIEYNRRLETWKAGRDPPILQELNTCFVGDDVVLV